MTYLTWEYEQNLFFGCCRYILKMFDFWAHSLLISKSSAKQISLLLFCSLYRWPFFPFIAGSGAHKRRNNVQKAEKRYNRELVLKGTTQRQVNPWNNQFYWHWERARHNKLIPNSKFHICQFICRFVAIYRTENSMQRMQKRWCLTMSCVT